MHIGKMGRFSSILLLLLVACGDNVTDDGVVSGLPDEVQPNGNATPLPRYVPTVCGVQSWTTNLADDAMNVSVAPFPGGAAVLATPRAGGSIAGFVLDTRMDMITATKVPIDGTFTQVTASYVNDRTVAAAVHDDTVVVNLLDENLANPQLLAKVPGRFLAEPGFFHTQAELVMPVVGDDGLWLHRFDDSLTLLDSKHVLATAPATAMTAAQLGVAMLTAWSTDSDCYLMLTSTYSPGTSARVESACNAPRVAVDQHTGAGVMVFEGADGVHQMPIQQTQFGGASRLVRPGSSAPRTVFDGSSFWVSYLDERGDVIVGFLDANRHLVSMSLGGPKPTAGAYDLVMVGQNPWILTLGSDGYSAYRLCAEPETN